MSGPGGALAGLALAILIAGCAPGTPPPSPPPPPTEVEALAHLDGLVALVRVGDLRRMCASNGGTCEQLVRGADPARVPTERPLVIDTWVIEPRLLGDGTWHAGGRVLELCGRDGLGEVYRSELLVFREGERLAAIAAPYWLGIGIAELPVTRGVPRPAATCP